MKEYLVVDASDNKIVAIYSTLAEAQGHKHLVEGYASYTIIIVEQEVKTNDTQSKEYTANTYTAPTGSRAVSRIIQDSGTSLEV